MFYVVFLVKKKADLTQEEFTSYWINDHTPLTAKLPGHLRRRSSRSMNLRRSCASSLPR